MKEGDYLSPEDLSAMFRIPKSSVYAWRHKGTGPRGIRVGKHLRYRREDVEAWLEERSDRRMAAGHG